MLRTANWEVVVDTKSGTLHKRKRLVFEPLPDYGSHMTWTDFCEMVAVGDIDDEDGSGTFATATTISNVDVPLDRIYNKIHHGGEDADVVVQKLKSPHDWATHVVWFNK
jgi:hypothetical protein